jgi:diguanylate cyclase
MSFVLDLSFLLLAAMGGAVVTCFLFWLRGGPHARPDQVADAHFAQETLGRLQELTHRVSAELDQHGQYVEEISAQLQSDDNDEASVVAAVQQLIEANQRMQRQLSTAEERLQTQAAQIESHAAEARTDSLTLVANRRALDDELTRRLAEFDASGIATTLMLLDVDQFKRFNDAHGHQAGDDALKTVARVLRQVVSEVGLVARYGGEEFAVVFAGLDLDAATPYCERARQAVGTTKFRSVGQELRITASAGLAQFLPGETEVDTLRRTDEALYASKKAGRNCGHLHDGRTCRLLKHAEPRSAAALAPTDDTSIGDEWLYQEDATESLFQEALPNVSSRPAFFDDLIRRLAQWRKTRTPLSLILVQVDAYPQIASDYGATAADAILRITSQLVNASMRDMDQVTRLSEDTFAMLLPGAMLQDAATIAERLRRAVERCRLPRRAGVNWFTISAGAVEASIGEDLHQILQRAREALHAAVSQGRNCVVTQAAARPVKRFEPSTAL